MALFLLHKDYGIEFLVFSHLFFRVFCVRDVFRTMTSYDNYSVVKLFSGA